MIGIVGLFEAVNWQRTLGACFLATIDGTVAVCRYSHQNDWMEAPRPAGTYEFTVEDGRIVHLKSNFIDFPEWDEFSSWMTLNHLDDKSTLFLQGNSVPATTPEALALWEQFTNEYVAERAAGG